MLDLFPITEEITSTEHKLVPIILMSIRRYRDEYEGIKGEEHMMRITGNKIEEKMNAFIEQINESVKEKGYFSMIMTNFEGERVRYTIDEEMKKLSKPRITKIVQYLRKQGHGIIADSKGYYYSDNENELVQQISSLFQRSRGCLEGAKGLINKLQEINPMKYRGISEECSCGKRLGVECMNNCSMADHSVHYDEFWNRNYHHAN